MFSRYDIIISVISNIEHIETYELSPPNAESFEVQQLLASLERFISIKIELQDGATTLHGARVIFDCVE